MAAIIYPFTAIVGQENMKKALILNAINPKLGGVLIRGEKGTAKSTAVRGLADLLPEINVVKDCPYHCDPTSLADMCQDCRAKSMAKSGLATSTRKMWVVDLPVSATEDRVVGTLDIEHAIKHGEKRFEPGVLAEANRGILYVDEVNLLADHLVDVLLDSAAMGVNTVEREGVSFFHPANFILVGTMNPEEGELRPQLLDRFALCVEIEGIDDVEQRVAVIKRRSAFEANSDRFIKQWRAEQIKLAKRIVSAKAILPRIRLSDDMLELIAQISIDMGVDGHRADIVIMKTATTIAAFNGRTHVTEQDVMDAAELALPHRMKRKPFDDQKMEEDKLRQSVEKHRERQEEKKKEEELRAASAASNTGDEGNDSNSDTPVQMAREQVFETGDPFNVRQIEIPKDRRMREGAGKRAKSASISRSGQYIRSTIPREKTSDIAFDATLRAAAPHQASRSKDGVSVAIRMGDIRQKVRESRIGSTIVFVVDASTSMGAARRMVAVKGAILSLLVDAYQRRDKVGMVSFRGDKAELILPPTDSVETARHKLENLAIGGKTPLPHGLALGYEVLKRELQKDKNTLPLLILISDGKANVSMYGGSPLDESKRIAEQMRAEGMRLIMVDTGQNYINLNLPRDMAELAGGLYFKLEDLESETIITMLQEEPDFAMRCRAFGNIFGGF